MPEELDPFKIAQKQLDEAAKNYEFGSPGSCHIEGTY